MSIPTIPTIPQDKEKEVFDSKSASNENDNKNTDKSKTPKFAGNRKDAKPPEPITDNKGNNQKQEPILINAVVNTTAKAEMRMMSFQGGVYVEIGIVIIDTAKDTMFPFKKIGIYRIDLEGEGAISTYHNGLPVCVYDIRYDLPLYSSWTRLDNAKSSRYAKTIYGEKTLEIILKVARSTLSTQWVSIIIGLAIGVPIGLFIGNVVNLNGGGGHAITTITQVAPIIRNFIGGIIDRYI